MVDADLVHKKLAFIETCVIAFCRIVRDRMEHE